MEPHRSALAREFREETGLDISVDKPAGIAEAISPGTDSHYVILSYFVSVTGGRQQAGDDAAEVRWAHRDDLKKLTLTPSLEDYLEQFGVWESQNEELLNPKP